MNKETKILLNSQTEVQKWEMKVGEIYRIDLWNYDEIEEFLCNWEWKIQIEGHSNMDFSRHYVKLLGIKNDKVTTNLQLKKDIQKATKYMEDFRLDVEVYTSEDTIDLNVAIYEIDEDGKEEYYSCCGVIENSPQCPTSEKYLVKEGKKIIKYLEKHFNNVNSVPHEYSC